jgi:hypothetical protein
VSSVKWRKEMMSKEDVVEWGERVEINEVDEVREREGDRETR